MAFVQSTATFGVSAGVSVTTATITTTAGNDAILTVGTFNASTPGPPSFTDSNSNTPCTIDIDAIDAGSNIGRASIGSVKITTAGAGHSWTISWNSSSYAGGNVSEFSDLDSYPSINKTASQAFTSAATTVTATTAATTQASELVIGSCANDAQIPSNPPTTGYTSLVVSSTGMSHESAYQSVAATGAQSATWTFVAGGFGVAVIATYKAARKVISLRTLGPGIYQPPMAGLF